MEGGLNFCCVLVLSWALCEIFGASTADFCASSAVGLDVSLATWHEQQGWTLLKHRVIVGAAQLTVELKPHPGPYPACYNMLLPVALYCFHQILENCQEMLLKLKVPTGVWLWHSSYICIYLWHFRQYDGDSETICQQLSLKSCLNSENWRLERWRVTPGVAMEFTKNVLCGSLVW